MNLEFIKLRSRIIKSIRQFFDERDFLEMHTPRLIGLPGQEPYLDPFWTIVETSDQKSGISGTQKIDVALITSPEYAMKRLLAEGFDRIYDLGSCFRNNEPWDGTHDPEFLLLEWYRRDAGLDELMNDTEEMMRFVCHSCENSLPADQAGNPSVDSSLRWDDRWGTWIPACAGMTKKYRWNDKWRRITVSEALKQYANVELEPLLDNREALAEVVCSHGQTVQSSDTWNDLFFKIFLSEVESHLGWNDDHTELHPIFLTHYPKSMAGLARLDSCDPRFALRVELYIGDFELANGFVELSDAVEQRKRFEEEIALRRQLGKRTWPIDERFIEALPQIGNAAGIAFGVDRLVMLLAGISSINDVIPFPARERFLY